MDANALAIILPVKYVRCLMDAQLPTDDLETAVRRTIAKKLGSGSLADTGTCVIFRRLDGTVILTHRHPFNESTLMYGVIADESNNGWTVGSLAKQHHARDWHTVTALVEAWFSWVTTARFEALAVPNSSAIW